MLAYRSMTDQNHSVEGIVATLELPTAAMPVANSLRTNRKRKAEP